MMPDTIYLQRIVDRTFGDALLSLCQLRMKLLRSEQWALHWKI
jgi:hypothetical protein